MKLILHSPSSTKRELNMDREKILKNLLSKTVERGCSKQEADTAQNMATKKAAEWGMNLEAVRKSLYLDGLSRKQRAIESGVVDFAEIFRRAAAERAPYHPNARCYTEPKVCKHIHRKVYRSNKEAWACKDCGFFTHEWQRKKAYWDNWKRAHSRPQAKKQTGCTNPFGVHGKGYDPERKWDSVADFVMWHLRNTDMPFDEIALQSRLKFSGKTSKNSVAWYANKIKKQGETIQPRRK